MPHFDLPLVLVTTSILANTANVLLVIIACIGLKQLSIAKDDIRLRSMREAATLSAKVCEKYAREFIPLGVDLRKKARAIKYPSFRGPYKDFLASELSHNEPAVAKLADPENKEFFPAIVGALNDLEGISIYFVKGIADEQIAYPVLANTFCEFVEQFYVVIAEHRPISGQKLYPNVVGLYKIWAPRIEKNRLEEQERVVSEKLKRLPPDDTVKPIGTE